MTAKEPPNHWDVDVNNIRIIIIIYGAGRFGVCYKL